MSESELAEYCRMSASALNRLLDRMESKELVRRKADPNDQRRVLVDVGKQGKKLSHLLSFHDQTNKTLLKGMNKTEEQQLVKLLERVIENINFELGEDH